MARLLAASPFGVYGQGWHPPVSKKDQKMENRFQVTLEPIDMGKAMYDQGFKDGRKGWPDRFQNQVSLPELYSDYRRGYDDGQAKLEFYRGQAVVSDMRGMTRTELAELGREDAVSGREHQNFAHPDQTYYDAGFNYGQIVKPEPKAKTLREVKPGYYLGHWTDNPKNEFYVIVTHDGRATPLQDPHKIWHPASNLRLLPIRGSLKISLP